MTVVVSEPRPVPAAPGRLPLVGHAGRLAVGRLRFLRSLREHGDLVRIHLGRQPAYVVNSPELLRTMLITEAESVDKGRFFDNMRPVLGTGILTCGTREHKRQRPLVQPAFHQDRIRRYVEIMADRAEHAADSWRPGQIVQFDHEMHALALNIVAATLFASDLGASAIEETQQMFPLISAGVARRTLVPLPWWDRLPTPGNRRFAAAVDRLWTVIDEVIAAYREQGVDHGDLLSMLLAAQDEHSGGLSDREVRDEVVTLMGAGTETSSNSLCWLFHELDRHPEVDERVRAEVDEVFGDGPIRFDGIRRLGYTTQVVNEVLRLHSPIWFLMRRVTEPVRLGDALLRPGDEVLFSPTALHRDHRVYPDPMRFDPERWGPGAEPPRNAFIPFGMGGRRCIGDVFARTEMLVITAAVVRRWRPRSADSRPVREVCAGSLHPARLPMTICPR
ncbi:cytochrome P450 [Kutzneria sp. CA-103260]|uniref:cytochrome P450 n=1 Tax=Kutzneria sp. CA-103260 TaxID=2802641 RepID=UPI001BA944DB|nr:cytochrome P450 [Kutzneria sp. CA-103260]QUQ65536.1 cytochrome P450 [Kutzneria sp. CA-103260]